MYSHGLGVTQDHAEAMKWYRKSADQGLAIAQNDLGAMYTHGHGVPQNHAEAIGWYRKAAEQGLAAAQTNIGTAYMLGSGVTQDDRRAVWWFRKAAEQGHVIAQASLGHAYAQGLGVTQDYAESLNLLSGPAQPPTKAKPWPSLLLATCTELAAAYLRTPCSPTCGSIWRPLRASPKQQKKETSALRSLKRSG
jgi:hypothetical protein